MQHSVWLPQDVYEIPQYILNMSFNCGLVLDNFAEVSERYSKKVTPLFSSTASTSFLGHSFSSSTLYVSRYSRTLLLADLPTCRDSHASVAQRLT